MRRMGLTRVAAENVVEAGVDPEDDLEQLKLGRVTPEALLARCLDGADEDREEGWRDYVARLVELARLESR